MNDNEEQFENNYLVLSNGRSTVMKRSKAIKYYRLTKYIANEFSKDLSTKVGSIFIYPETMQVLSMGYNGMPRKINENLPSRWERPLKYKFTEHAERNAIYNAAQSGTPLRDSICVVSLFPCSDCVRGIIQTGCKMVISENFYEYEKSNNAMEQERFNRWKSDWDISMEMLKEADVQIILLRKSEIDKRSENHSLENHSM
jgi:dCMP deaminase